MTILEAIQSRHSVRKYKDIPIPEESLSAIRAKIEELNKDGNLNIQMVNDEPKAFSGLKSYGTFSGVKNYFVMAGKKSDNLEENIGYYG